MSFPTISFKGTNTEVSDQLKTLTEHKLSTLDKFTKDHPGSCEVEFEKITNHHQQGNIHRIEINLLLNGKLHRAEATSESFEKAIDEAKADLQHELQSTQGKRQSLFKRGARRVKEMVRFGG